MSILLNNDTFTIDVTIYNADGILNIPHTQLTSLSFKYDIIDWSIIGTFEYSDPYDASERFTLSDAPYSEAFYFKNDGSDMISISVSLHDTAPDISAIFAVTDIVGSKSDISENAKVIYFTDLLTHSLKKTNIDISTAYINNDLTSLSDLNNTDRSANILDILTTIAYAADSDTEFDTTEESKNSIFYTSSAFDNGYDAFNYILKKYVGNDKTFGVVRFNLDSGEYDIQSIGALIATYDDMVIERFTIADNVRISDDTFNSYQSSRPSVDFGVHSNIAEYEYSKVSPIQNMQINVSKSVATYDTSTKTFDMMNEDLSVQTIKTKFINKIATPMQNASSSEVYPMLSIDTTRLNGGNTIALYTLNDNTLYDHINDSLKSMIMLNDAISFSVLGYMGRKVGDVIEIISPNMENGRWANRMYGFWLVLNITHSFANGQYINNIYAVKLSANDALELNNEI